MSLFQTGTKEWDLEIINDIFWYQGYIVNTMVEQDLDRDVLSWKLELSGQLSVKSAYKLLQEQKGAWSANDNVGFWKKMWNIKAPPKVLILIWRAVTYCLPSKVQLQTKHVQINNIFPVCNEGVESIFHALVQCRSAALCWKIYNPGINTDECMEFPMWIERRLPGQSKNSKAKIITLSGEP